MALLQYFGVDMQCCDADQTKITHAPIDQQRSYSVE